MSASSGVSPELDSASTASLSTIMPRSPWLASAGCTYIAGDPVEASVAAILLPIWPLLPMPVTTIRPFALDNEFQRLAEGLIQARRQGLQSVCLDAKHAHCRREIPRRVRLSARAPAFRRWLWLGCHSPCLPVNCRILDRLYGMAASQYTASAAPNLRNPL